MVAILHPHSPPLYGSLGGTIGSRMGNKFLVKKAGQWPINKQTVEGEHQPRAKYTWRPREDMRSSWKAIEEHEASEKGKQQR